MPTVVYWVGGLAALITALGVLWTKAVRPAARLIAASEELIPLLRELTVAFRDTPHVFAILDEIVSQVRNDSGSTLKDIVEALERTGAVNEEAVGKLTDNLAALNVAVEVVKALLAALDARVVSGAIRAQASSDKAQEDRVVIAADLAAAHERADAVPASGDSGGAADAAMRTEPPA